MLRHTVLICAILAAVTAAKADDRDIVARVFATNPDYIIMNLPPRPDVWPGAIFTANLRIPIVHGNSKDPALHRGAPVAIDANSGFDLNAGTKGGLSNLIGISTDVGNVADVVLSFPDARIVDMDLNELVKRVEASTAAIEAAKRGQIPLIVIKAYYGTPTVTITRKTNASGSAWIKLRTRAEADAKASAASTNSLTYKSKEEFVFAFEAAQIQPDPSDLNKGKLNIRFSSLPAQLYAFRENEDELDIARTIAAKTGISIDDLKNKGILTGEASFIRNPLGCALGFGGRC